MYALDHFEALIDAICRNSAFKYAGMYLPVPMSRSILWDIGVDCQGHAAQLLKNQLRWWNCRAWDPSVAPFFSGSGTRPLYAGGFFAAMAMTHQDQKLFISEQLLAFDGHIMPRLGKKRVQKIEENESCL
jgi:hypothetical protein